MDQEDDWAEASEALTPESSAVDSDTVHHRLCELESDSEGGWLEEDRHEVSLVRVPTNLLKAVELQVLQCPALEQHRASFSIHQDILSSITATPASFHFS
jgi:hypothetical protein